MSDEKTVETQPETPVEQKPEAKETAKPDVPAEQKPETGSGTRQTRGF